MTLSCLQICHVQEVTCPAGDRIPDHPPIGPIVNLNQLTDVTIVPDPGVVWSGGSPARVITQPLQSWSLSPSTTFEDCSQATYMTVDLGDFYWITGTTVWHSTGQLAVTVSVSSAFLLSLVEEGDSAVEDCWLTNDEIIGDPEVSEFVAAFKDSIAATMGRDDDDIIVDSVSVDGDDIPRCRSADQPGSWP